MEERLQKLISACGLASRRTAEGWITAGRVTVNGRTAHLGDRADPDRDEILVDGTPLDPGGGRTYLMLNKPRGYVTTLSDEKGRRTVADLVSDCGARVWPVGRLDMDSEGLLLLTDDGELTHRLLHPSHEIEKEYLVWVTGDVKRALPILSAPMELAGDMLSPAKVRRGRVIGGVSQLSIVIHQGKNRQVRRMCAQAGLTVLRLKRIREGGLSLDRSLAPGKWRALTGQELLLLSQEGKKED
ncbi:pseudouridine synthase [Pseudoflavonifractor phocaeensis]|uniref:pseudouridine synthase n=1 Tax=Pseudoflavonifractor phocaeensis TaxID=1870988 RepID=UPI001F362E51|nr:pseudouridine synthase [Pseudoflavonifractor phocaeensis]MCF2661047.1 rRNA pseudouridine synthase [Pseudoflavonifractor phocaeensis]